VGRSRWENSAIVDYPFACDCNRYGPIPVRQVGLSNLISPGRTRREPLRTGAKSLLGALAVRDHALIKIRIASQLARAGACLRQLLA
jgi:hypothetical protein